MRQQLGRSIRGAEVVAYRCPCGRPAVVTTHPELDDGTPFPTMYYLTCPRASVICSRLESEGLMRQMESRLAEDEDLCDHYRRAHDSYLLERSRLGEVPQIAGISAGGMPNRVKCLHVLCAHALAAGPGVNPLGDEVVAALGEWWKPIDCSVINRADDQP